MTSRISCADSSVPTAAMAPMFQMTGRFASRLVVPMSKRRPLAYSCAISSIISASMCFCSTSRIGAVSPNASLVRPAISERFLTRSDVDSVVYRLSSSSS